VYRSVESDETGAELRVRLDTVRVLGDTAAFGRRWAVVRGNPLVVAGTIAPRQYLSWRPGGLWHAESLDPGPIPGVEPGTWVFPSPAEPGRYYPYAGAYARGVTAEATDDAVNTPAGAFRCVRFTHPYVVGASECVAPGVGLVEAVSAPAYSTDAAGNVTHTYWTTARLVSGPTAP
jgi:hypothetical protein